MDAISRLSSRVFAIGRSDIVHLRHDDVSKRWTRYNNILFVSYPGISQKYKGTIINDAVRYRGTINDDDDEDVLVPMGRKKKNNKIEMSWTRSMHKCIDCRIVRLKRIRRRARRQY